MSLYRKALAKNKKNDKQADVKRPMSDSSSSASSESEGESTNLKKRPSPSKSSQINKSSKKGSDDIRDRRKSGESTSDSSGLEQEMSQMSVQNPSDPESVNAHDALFRNHDLFRYRCRVQDAQTKAEKQRLIEELHKEIDEQFDDLF